MKVAADSITLFELRMMHWGFQPLPHSRDQMEVDVDVDKNVNP